MKSIPPFETGGLEFPPYYNIEDSRQFSEIMPIMLDIIDPLADLSGINKKYRKRIEGRIDQEKSFKQRSVRADFYNSLNENQLNEVLFYFCKNYQEDRLINFFHSVAQEIKVKIIENMLDLAFKACLISYTKEIAGIRRKIAKGYIKPAENMDIAFLSVMNADNMKAILFLNQNPDKIGEFITHFQSDPKAMNGILKNIMKWVPKGEYLTH